MIFDDIILPYDRKTFDDMKGRRPLYIHKINSRVKKNISGLLSWSKINQHVNTFSNVEEIWKTWNEKGCMSVVTYEMTEQLFHFQNQIADAYGPEFCCQVTVVMNRNVEDFPNEKETQDCDKFLVQVIGSGEVEVFPKKKKEGQEWNDDDDEIYIPIIEEEMTQGDIVYLPANIYHNYRPTGVSIMLEILVYKGKRIQKKEFYDFMPVRGRIIKDEKLGQPVKYSVATASSEL